MKSLLHQIKEHIVKEVKSFPHNKIIKFENGSELNIINTCIWEGGGLNDLVGLVVTEIVDDEKKIEFLFGNKVRLSLKAVPDTEDPEVLTLSLPGVPLIVVN